MKNMNPIRDLLFLSALVACGAARAKTVALWPLETNDLHCVVNPSNDLNKVSAHFNGTGVEAQWKLPPNPDSNRHAFEPVNRTAVRESFSGSDKGFLYNDYSGIYMGRDKDFTVEGYIKVFSLPASNEWAFIVGAYGKEQDANDKRWMLSFRRRSDENYACSWILWGYNSTDTLLYRYADEEASYAITNTWMHVALVHEALSNGTRGTDHWKLYLNGALAGESRNDGALTDGSHTPRFELGGRLVGNDGRQIEAAFDYWRISDKALEPSEFLCAGDSSGTPAPSASHTVAYWPLGVTETGGVDCRDAVGTSPLTGGFYDAKFKRNRMTPVEDCAFAGNPPNTTVTLSGGNTGSFLGSATASCLQNDSVGGFLNVTSNFTVEGWFCPRICERATKKVDGEAVCQLFGTRPDYNPGWMFQYRAKGISNAQFDIFCQDGSGTTLINNAKLSESFDMSSWYDAWRHVALTYNAVGGANGNGLWTLYIDGVQVGSAANSRTPVAITSSRPFNLGGRAAIANQSFQGKIDCVRVCATVLSPNQFLNATAGAAAATDVVALWSLNVVNGEYPDLRDVSGGGRHFASLNSNYAKRLVAADPGNAPTINNPDKTSTFRGDPSRVNGSVRFRNPDATTDTENSELMTASSDVTSVMAAGKDFTFEFYYQRRQAEKSGEFEEVFLTAADTEDAQPNARIRFFRKPAGFYIWEKYNATVGDTLIPGTSDSVMESGRWYHVALVHSIETIGGTRSSVWRVYLEGQLKHTQSAAYNNSTVDTLTAVYVGGRHWRTNNSVVGNLSSVRLSNRALDPSEFLCAVPAAGEKPEPTVGYWPIDSIQPGLANLADEEYPLVADGTAAGQDEKARLAIPNKNALTNVVTDSARLNHGSYALGAGGVLAAASIGFDMAGPKPFTVEGWLNWTPAAGTADEDLITVGDAHSANGGLRIFFDKTGASPKLRVFARGAWPCTPYVDGTFDADLTSLAGTWAHVAIVYDANDGAGSWTLYVEGKQVGQVKNFYRPTPVDYSRGGDFRIGSAAHPLSAAVDMWRVSTVAYAPADLLYAPLGGMVILFR